MKSNRRIDRVKKWNEEINLRLENIVFAREELYYVIEIKNASPVLPGVERFLDPLKQLD